MAVESPSDMEPFPHLVGWWIEVTPDAPVIRKRWFREPVTTCRWRWYLKRPDPIMSFGFSISGSGVASSEDGAVAEARERAAWWEDWKVRQDQQRRIDL
jgi:hypothetical protein